MLNATKIGKTALILKVFELKCKTYNYWVI